MSDPWSIRRLHVFGAICGCPIGERKDSCLFSGLELNLATPMLDVEAMSDLQVNHYYEQCCACLSEQESPLVGEPDLVASVRLGAQAAAG